MEDRYSRGSKEDWLQHSNEELARMVRRWRFTAAVYRTLCILFLVVLTWVLFKYSEAASWEELWRWPEPREQSLNAARMLLAAGHCVMT